MNRSKILEVLAERQEELQHLGVISLALFGSTARDEARANSDIDLLVEVRRPMGAFALLDIKNYLEALLGRRVDLVTPQALKSRIRANVIGEAVSVFGQTPAA